MITSETPWTTLLGADEYNPIRDLGAEAYALYTWLRAIAPDRGDVVDLEDAPPAYDPPVDADGLRVRFARTDAPVDLTKAQLEGCLQSIRSNGWSYGHVVHSDGNAADVYMGTYGRAPAWAADEKFHDLLREGVLPERYAVQAMRACGFPVEPARSAQIDDREVAPPDQVDHDDGRVQQKADRLERLMADQKEKTDEVRKQEEQKWRERGYAVEADDREMGRTGNISGDGTPWGFREDGEIKRNKHGLWRLYQRLFEREFDVPPPSLWTESGKPSKNAHRLGRIADEYSIDVAIEAVGELVTRWDAVQEARGITAPPVPSQVWRLKDTVCYAIESGEDPIERLGGESGGTDDSEWDDEDDINTEFNQF